MLGCDFNKINPPPPCNDPTLTLPPQPDASTATSTTVTYAFDSILFGDRRRDSTETSTTAWKSFGLDIDGKKTDAKSTDVCTRVAGAPSAVQADGTTSFCAPASADNSFGANVLPIVQSAGSVPTPSGTYTDSLRAGSFTLQFRIKGLELGAVHQDNAGLIVESFTSNTFDGTQPPAFLPSEDWPVRADLHPDPNKGNAFATAYITHDVLVATGGEVVLSVVDGPARIDFHIHRATIVMTIRGDSAELGTLAGVLNVEEFIDDAHPFTAAVSKAGCGSAYDGISQQLRMCADILDDGTNGPGRMCNAISIGIGFTAKRIANPSRAVPKKVLPDPCAISDAGPD